MLSPHSIVTVSFKKNLFLAIVDLHCCAGFSLVVVSGGSSLVVVAALVAEHGL